MTSITITYAFSDSGRRHMLTTGKPGTVCGSVVITPESPEWSRAAAVADIDGDGNGKIQLHYSNAEYVKWDREPAVTELLANAEMVRDAKLAQVDDELSVTEAADARALAGKLTVVANSLGEIKWDAGDGWRTLNYAKGQEHRLVTRNSPAWAEWMAEIDAHNAAVRAAHKLAEDERKAKAKAEHQAALDVLRSWTREHGSELARLRLEEGYDCWVSAARTEYAAAVALDVMGRGEDSDYPDGYDDCDTEPVKCPGLADLKALRAAKVRIGDRTDVTADLVRVTYTTSDDDENVVRNELRLTVQVPGTAEVESYYLIPSE